MDGPELSVSVLSPLEPLAFACERELLAQLEIGDAGLVIADHGHRTVFLSQVWGQLPDQTVFPRPAQDRGRAVARRKPDASGLALRTWRFRVDSVDREAK